MSEFYDAKAALVQNQLKRYGQPITLVRDIAGVFDPITGAVSGGETQRLICSGILTNYQQSLVDGERIQLGDKKLLLAPDNLPLMSDKIEDRHGQRWQIVRIESVSPAGVDLLYKIQVRR